MPENALSLEMLRYSNSSLSPACFIFAKMSIDLFLLEANYSFLNIKEIDVYIRIGFLIDEVWQSGISIEMSRYSSLFFSKTAQLKFLSSSDMTVVYIDIQMENSVILSITLEH